MPSIHKPNTDRGLLEIETMSITTTDLRNGPVPVLEVVDLRVEFPSDDGVVKAVDGVSFAVQANETVGIVGESGSGKSVTSMAILGLLPRAAKVTGEVRFKGQNILGRPERELRTLRGDQIAMVFQDALAALNPVFTVGDQIAEAVSVHHEMSKADLRKRAVELFDLVGIPNPSTRVDNYPHEFSGGMRQRAMIAMAIANNPALLIADEPTTALDVTIQAQVLEVFARIQELSNTSVILITHDLGVVAGVSDRVMVMYAGREVETGTVEQVFYNPSHPYTRGLLGSLPRLDRRREGEKLHKIKGQPPSLVFLPPGCAFSPRCPYARHGVCDVARPELHLVADGQESACLRFTELPPYSLEGERDASGMTPLGGSGRPAADPAAASHEVWKPAGPAESDAAEPIVNRGSEITGTPRTPGEATA
jgi:oligopeptide/dipeptide ABC transporter ATP-binding protein